ncbi:MAG: hypothetical protein AB1540_07870 [Bdellovibrionota bacterium]
MAQSRRFTLFCALILVTCLPWAISDDEQKKWATHFNNPTISTLNSNEISPLFAEYTHEFSITAVIARNSGWTLGEVKTRLLYAAEIYSQCKVRVSQIKFVVVDAPPGLRFLSRTENPFATTEGYEVQVERGSDSMLAVSIPETEKPVLFYWEDVESRAGPAYAQSAYANKLEPKLAGTAYFSFVRTLNNEEFYRPYQKHGTRIVDAHELAHLLVDFDHQEEPKNILSGWHYNMSEKILDWQCEAIRRSPLVRLIP